MTAIRAARVERVWRRRTAGIGFNSVVAAFGIDRLTCRSYELSLGARSQTADRREAALTREIRFDLDAEVFADPRHVRCAFYRLRCQFLASWEPQDLSKLQAPVVRLRFSAGCASSRATASPRINSGTPFTVSRILRRDVRTAGQQPADLRVSSPLSRPDLIGDPNGGPHTLVGMSGSAGLQLSKLAWIPWRRLGMTSSGRNAGRAGNRRFLADPATLDLSHHPVAGPQPRRSLRGTLPRVAALKIVSRTSRTT